MKHTKRIFALLLSAVMVLAVSIPAFAVSTKGSITIENPTIGKEYNLYKIFDASYGSNDSAAYYINSSSEWYSLVSATGSPFKLEQLSGSTNKYLVSQISDDNTVTAWFNSNSVKTAVSGFTAVDTKTPTNTDNTVKFSNLDFGYYYVTSTLGAAVTVTNAKADVTIIDKNQQPGWGENGGKFIKNDSGVWTNQNTANIGDKLDYKLVIDNAVNYAGAEKIQEYIIEDTFGDAIDVDFSTIKINIGGTEIKNGYIIENDSTGNPINRPIDPNDTVTTKDNCKWYVLNKVADDNIFDIHIKWQDISGNFVYTAPTDIEITYNAVLQANASIGTDCESDNTNTAIAKWKTASNTYSDEEKTVITYTYGFGIFKYIAGTESVSQDCEESESFIFTTGGTPLAGAKFQLKDKDGNVITLLKSKTKDDVYYINNAVTQAYADCDYTDKTSVLNEFVTPADGEVLIIGLKEGEYRLIETAAPDGYNQLKDPVVVTLNSDNSVDYINDINCIKTSVANSTGTLLPETGGMGTVIFVALGALVAVAAGLFLVTNKRMSKEDI